MDTDAPSPSPPATTSSTTTRMRGAKSALTPLLPEVDAFLHLLVLLYLLDNAPADKAVDCADALIKKVVMQNRRSLDKFHISLPCLIF